MEKKEEYNEFGWGVGIKKEEEKEEEKGKVKNKGKYKVKYVVFINMWNDE